MVTATVNRHAVAAACSEYSFLPRQSHDGAGRKQNTTGTTHRDSIRDNSPQIISAPPQGIAPSQKATSKEKPSSVSTTVLVLAAWASVFAWASASASSAVAAHTVVAASYLRVWKLRPVRMKKRNSPDEPRRDPTCLNNARERTAHGATQQRALKPEQQDSTKDSQPQLTGEHVANRECKFCYEWEKDEHVLSLCRKTQVSFL